MKSPLRYPGGKAKIAPLLEAIMKANSLSGACYVEPYAGGAGAGLQLLANEFVDRIILNDSDPFIAALWGMCLHKSSRFISRIENVRVTMNEWRRQRSIYVKPGRGSRETLGFAALFLNRCNRSGIISGGPIGGHSQAGKWKLDVRFSKQTLVGRIRDIASYGERITFLKEDALTLLRNLDEHAVPPEKTFVYLDPPYFEKANRLYSNHYNKDDHADLSKFLVKDATFPWVLTYDDHPEIRGLYKSHATYQFSLNYSAQKKRKGTELLVLSEELEMPSTIIADYKLVRL